MHLLIFFLLALSVTCQVQEDILCENRVFEPKCPQGTIRIVAAAFGKTDSPICGGKDSNQPWGINCGVEVTEDVRSICGGRTSCSLPVQGRDACVGARKFLQVIWGCETSIPQNRVNNRNIDIVFSAMPDRSNFQLLHTKTVTGSIYLFLNSPQNAGIVSVSWFIDQPNVVVSQESTHPYDLRDGSPWDTSFISNGQHRAMASINFADGTVGSIDATFTVQNLVVNLARAVSKASDLYVETGDGSSSPTVSSTTKSTTFPVLPWSLFGAASVVVVILIVVIAIRGKSTGGVFNRL